MSALQSLSKNPLSKDPLSKDLEPPRAGHPALRVAVVGCGYWGSKHLRVLQSLDGVESVTAIDPDPSRRAAAERILYNAASAPSLEAVLSRIDALVIATPPATHATLALQALRAGKHVLVEKPLSTTTASAGQLIDAARESGTTLMVGHTFEHNPAVWKMRELITTGALGRLYYIDSARLNLGLYQGDVNVIFDLAPHDISIVNYLLGAQPTSVEAWASRHAHARLEDVAYLRLQYASLGVEANIHVSWLDPAKVRRLTAVGSLKMAVYNDMTADEPIRVYDKGVVAGHDHELGQPPMTYRYGDITSPRVEFREPLAVQDEHFLSCIASKSTPRTDGSNGRAVVAVLEAAVTSFKERRLVELEDLEDLNDRPLALSGATQ